VRTAASGHDCLDLLAAGLQPDVVFLDLAMPGIDGWETLRRIRAMAGPGSGTSPQVAIVSANAFDRGLDNGLGLPPEDFIVKPVRHSELLDWLERKLELVWLESTAPAVATPTTAAAMVNPPRDEVIALQALVRLGFYRGIVNKLDALAISFPECTDFVDQQRALARQYQFETMQAQLQGVLNESPVH
jgi:CheY-like chemotaxis protein